MPSPMLIDHGGTSGIVGGWLFYYQWKTPGVKGRGGSDDQARIIRRAAA